MTTQSRPSEERHDAIEAGLNLLKSYEHGGIRSWRYETAAGRYVVFLDGDFEVQGGKPATDMLVMTMLAAEAFLVGSAVTRAAGFSGRTFVVDPEGSVDVQ